MSLIVGKYRKQKNHNNISYRETCDYRRSNLLLLFIRVAVCIHGTLFGLN